MKYIGKVLNVVDYELKFGTKQQKINAYACFKNLSDGTITIIYSFTDSNELLYANAHLKGNKIILMKTKEKDDIVLNFINDFLNNNLDKFEIISIEDKNSVEIISYNKLDKNIDIKLLFDKTIYVKNENDNSKEEVSNIKLFSIFFLVIIILVIGCYIYVNKEKIFTSNNSYYCELNYEHDELDVNVVELRKLSFTNKELVKEDIEVIFKFNDSYEYNEFKQNKEEYNYSIYNKGTYKYIDEEKALKMFYDNYKNKNLSSSKLTSVIEYYEHKNYKCEIIEKE